MRKFSLVALALVMSFTLFPIGALADEEEEFVKFSESEAIIESEEDVYEEMSDLTGLTSEEAAKLDEDDYIEYQMQMGNYTIEKDGTLIVPD